MEPRILVQMANQIVFSSIAQNCRYSRDFGQFLCRAIGVAAQGYHFNVRIIRGGLSQQITALAISHMSDGAGVEDKDIRSVSRGTISQPAWVSCLAISPDSAWLSLQPRVSIAILRVLWLII